MCGTTTPYPQHGWGVVGVPMMRSFLFYLLFFFLLLSLRQENMMATESSSRHKKNYLAVPPFSRLEECGEGKEGRKE